jgi:lipopolysaccharide export system permease protein
MTLLDRYLVKKFFVNFILAIAAFMVIFLVVDLIENVDDYLNKGASLYATSIYYLYYIPYIISLTLPVCLLLACLFSLGNMSQHNEIMAQKSAGISLYRLFLPLFVIGLLMSLAAGILNESVVPWCNKSRLDLKRANYDMQKAAESKEKKKTENNLSIQDEKNRKVTISTYVNKTMTGRNVSILMFDGAIINHRYDAKELIWLDEQWVLVDVKERIFEDSTETLYKHDTLRTIVLNFKPDDLGELETQPEEMRYSELKAFIEQREEIGGDVRKWLVELYLKISYPFACFIIILFGAPIAAQKRRSGTAIGIGISLLVCFIYFIFIRTGQVMGHQGDLSPWLAAWIGNIVFGAAGIIGLLKTRK